MQREIENLRSKVLTLAGKYSDVRKRRELDQVFSLLAKELEHEQLQSQRIMVLLRAIMTAQPGSAKIVNEFLKSPKIANAMQAGGGYNLD